jgi:diguanylate cyclase (GGDEF)-like protein
VEAGVVPQRASAFSARLDNLERHRAVGVGDRLADARTVEASAAAAGDVVAVRRAQLVAADMLHRLGHVSEGARLAVEVNAWAGAHGPAALLARSHLVLSSLFESAGDVLSALDHAVRAIDLCDEETPSRARGNYVLRLADALTMTGSTDEARARYSDAEAIFAEIGDRERRLNVLNNLTVLEYETGEAAAAAATAERLWAMSDLDELNPSCAETIGRARLTVGNLAQAEVAVRLGLDLWRKHGDAQAATPAELGLTLAEVLLAEGRIDEAATELDWCQEVCRERDLHGMYVETLRVRAQLLAARRAFEGAYDVHCEYHTESVALHSRRLEAAARTRQALFETAEARREASRFRIQARTDTLTGLPNRRFVNEELPRLLREQPDRRGCLAAAIIDVDHFKAINDRFSHQVGDEVLGRLGTIMAQAVVSSGMRPEAAWPEFAARLGGEEFLVVLCAHSSAEAAARVERLCTAVAMHEWDDLAPSLQVTVSAGLVYSTPTDDQVELLGRADAHLYAAKEQGRNRVVADAVT